MLIRNETYADDPCIVHIVQHAFADHPHSLGNEVAMVRGLRVAGALTVSLVVEVDGLVRGYVAASPVQIDGRSSGWHGLGPIAIEPAVQGLGLGSSLVLACLAELRRSGSAG